MSKTFWNPEIETLSAAEVTRLEMERLPVQLDYMRQTSRFYARQIAASGLQPAQIRSRDALSRIPFTEKPQLSAFQADGALIGEHQCARLDQIVRIQATGGTTSQPMRIGLTRQDVADYCEMGARALWAMGCRPGDIVFECMNYNLYAGGLSDHLTFETLGAATIPYGVGHSMKLIEMMRAIRDDVCIWATPSYAVRLAEIARNAGLGPRDIGLRKGFFSGEPGIQVPGYRQSIEETWGMVAQDMYGTGELGMHCGECEQRQGVHYQATGFVLTELIDPDTGSPIDFDDGVIGEFVYTSIRRQASPLLRMRSRDLMQVFTAPCACGRTSFRFKVLGRSDDMFIVKGVNVFPQAVQAVLMGLHPRLTGEFYIVLERAPPIDYAPVIVAEVSRDLPDSERANLTKESERRITEKLNFSAQVVLTGQGAIATERKTRRLYRRYRGEEPPSAGSPQ